MRSTADHIFGVDEAILVTQWFHLDRALYTCDKLGIDGVGVAAGPRYCYEAAMRTHGGDCS